MVFPCNMFYEGFSVIVQKLYLSNIEVITFFIIKKLAYIKWDVTIPSSQWDCCWKCEFDTDVKIIYHHDGE